MDSSPPQRERWLTTVKVGLCEGGALALLMSLCCLGYVAYAGDFAVAYIGWGAFLGAASPVVVIGARVAGPLRKRHHAAGITALWALTIGWGLQWSYLNVLAQGRGARAAYDVVHERVLAWLTLGWAPFYSAAWALSLALPLWLLVWQRHARVRLVWQLLLPPALALGADLGLRWVDLWKAGLSGSHVWTIWSGVSAFPKACFCLLTAAAGPLSERLALRLGRASD